MNLKKKTLHILNEDNISPLLITSIIAGIVVFNKLISLFYQNFITNTLGTSSIDLKIFDTASILPELINQIFLMGLIGSCVIPILNEARAKYGEKISDNFFGISLKLFGGIYALLALIIFLNANFFIGLIPKINPGSTFLPNSEQLELIKNLMMILLLPQGILGISAFLSSGLQFKAKYIIPQLTGLIYSTTLLVASALLLKVQTISNYDALVFAVIIASIMHLAIQLPLLRKLNFLKVSFGWNKKIFRTNSEKFKYLIKKLGLTALPRIITLSFDQVLQKLSLIVALGLGESSLRHYKLAGLIYNLPFTLFAYSNSVIAFNHIAREYAENNIEKAKDVFNNLIQNFLFLSIPIISILIILRLPIVRLTFGLFFNNGKFTWEDTVAVAAVLFALAVGTIPEILSIFGTRLFFAFHRTRLPFIVSLLIFIITVICLSLLPQLTQFLSPVFINLDLSTNDVSTLSVTSLAIIFSIANIINFIIIYLTINFRLFQLNSSFWKNILNKFTSGIIMSTVMYLIYRLLETLVHTGNVSIDMVILLSVSVIVGVVTYLLSGLFLKVEQAYMLKAKIQAIFNF